MCSKIYDYKDETKDVKAKVSDLNLTIQTERLNAVQELQQMLTDQKNVT